METERLTVKFGQQFKSLSTNSVLFEKITKQSRPQKRKMKRLLKVVVKPEGKKNLNFSYSFSKFSQVNEEKEADDLSTLGSRN